MKMKKVAVLLMLAILVIGFVGCHNSSTSDLPWGDKIEGYFHNQDRKCSGYQPSILDPISKILLGIGVVLIGISNLVAQRKITKLEVRVDELEKKLGNSE